MSIFGNNIKKIRILKNLSQQDFGELFEISRGSIGSYEEGRAEPKLESVIKIASYYNLSIDALLTKELTVNDLSNFTNKISKHVLYTTESKESKPNLTSNKIYLEDRIDALEKKIADLEKKIFKK